MIYCFFVSPKSIIKLSEKHIMFCMKIIFTDFIIILYVIKKIILHIHVMIMYVIVIEYETTL